MQIKTYKDFSMKDVLARIKTEMGSEAMIISTREVKSDSFGMLSRPMVEVTAAVDYDQDVYSRQAQAAARPDRGVPGKTLAASAVAGADLGALSVEMADMKRMMNALLLRAENTPATEGNLVRQGLVAQGIKDSLVDLMLNKLGAEAALPAIRTLLSKLVRTTQASDERVHVFLGTTGVGKTTTVAKLAARMTLGEHKEVGIVTLDTFRIGAMEQSKIYARILNIPLYSATSPDEFRAALDRLADKDMILVDTVGRSALREDYIEEMQPYFKGCPMCKYLLLPVATREQEMEKITRCFAACGIDRMIFTKVDEALVHGSIITHNLLFRIPVSYLTLGQRVPEDIAEASSASILDLCLGDMT